MVFFLIRYNFNLPMFCFSSGQKNRCRVCRPLDREPQPRGGGAERGQNHQDHPGQWGQSSHPTSRQVVKQTRKTKRQNYTVFVLLSRAGHCNEFLRQAPKKGWAVSMAGCDNYLTENSLFCWRLCCGESVPFRIFTNVAYSIAKFLFCF